MRLYLVEEAGDSRPELRFDAIAPVGEGGVNAVVCAASTDATVEAPYVINDGHWHHITVLFDSVAPKERMVTFVVDGKSALSSCQSDSTDMDPERFFRFMKAAPRKDDASDGEVSSSLNNAAKASATLGEHPYLENYGSFQRLMHSPPPPPATFEVVGELKLSSYTPAELSKPDVLDELKDAVAIIADTDRDAVTIHVEQDEGDAQLGISAGLGASKGAVVKYVIKTEDKSAGDVMSKHIKEMPPSEIVQDLKKAGLTKVTTKSMTIVAPLVENRPPAPGMPISPSPPPPPPSPAPPFFDHFGGDVGGFLPLTTLLLGAGSLAQEASESALDATLDDVAFYYRLLTKSEINAIARHVPCPTGVQKKKGWAYFPNEEVVRGKERLVVQGAEGCRGDHMVSFRYLESTGADAELVFGGNTSNSTMSRTEFLQSAKVRDGDRHTWRWTTPAAVTLDGDAPMLKRAGNPRDGGLVGQDNGVQMPGPLGWAHHSHFF